MILYALNLGLYDVDETVLNSEAEKGARVRVPVWALLVRCDGGCVLFDLGCMEEDKNLAAAPDQTMEAQLALLGLSPADVNAVVISHLHGDHFGALNLFTHADVYAPAEEWTEALINAHLTAQSRKSALAKRLELPVKAWHPVPKGGDFELIPGVYVLTLPGHTPNLLGLRVECGAKTLVFPSDCVYSPVNFNVLPGACRRPDEYIASREKILALEKAGAEIVFSHWTEQFERLPKAPLPLCSSEERGAKSE